MILLSRYYKLHLNFMPWLLSTLLSLILFVLSPYSYAGNSSPPALTLAKTYQGQVDLSHYWVSEKLDGVRAYWNGQQLISKQGNTYHAPAWFTRDFPSQPLDGELWIGRGQFQSLISTVRKNKAIDAEWQQVRYYIFDMPDLKGSFNQRLTKLKQLIAQSKSPYLRVVKQYQLFHEPELMTELDRIVAIGGEGLMLHRAAALYHAGRNNDVLKVKPYFDAEATVIDHVPGKGKYTSLLGALLVKSTEGLTFRIGSGLSDQERTTPPAIGSVITYTYHGKTLKGIPRFASFLRIRKK